MHDEFTIIVFNSYLRMLIKPPKFIRRIFPDLIWNLDTPENRDKIFLTFDDGPTPGVTEHILDTLDRYGAKATFFCLGKNVEQYPHLYHMMVERGHVVANHSYSHIKGWGVHTGRYVEDIDLADSFIHSNLFRPPYGRIKPTQSRRLNERYKLIMWEVLSRDYSHWVTPEQCLKNVVKNAKGGSIVVFHDSLKAFKNMSYALEGSLKELSERGYSFDVISL